MTFLKSFGKIAEWVGRILGIMPLVETVYRPAPGTGMAVAVSEIEQIGNVLLTSEQMFAAAYGPDAKKGSDKLKAAIPYVGQIIQRSSFLAGKKLINPTLFQDATTRLVSAFADILNAFGE